MTIKHLGTTTLDPATRRAAAPIIRPSWRTVNLAHFKYRIEKAVNLPTMWCAYRDAPSNYASPDFKTFTTWREAMDYALARVAESMATEGEFSC